MRQDRIGERLNLQERQQREPVGSPIPHEACCGEAEARTELGEEMVQILNFRTAPNGAVLRHIFDDNDRFQYSGQYSGRILEAQMALGSQRIRNLSTR